MKKNTLAELNQLLDTMLELPPEDRRRWVDELGPEHEPVKLRLIALLEHSGRVETNDFLGTLPRVDGIEFVEQSFQLGLFHVVRVGLEALDGRTRGLCRLVGGPRDPVARQQAGRHRFQRS